MTLDVGRVRLSTCPDSWGVWYADHPAQPAWTTFLDEIRDVGFRWTELGPPGFLPIDHEVLKGELEERGLGAVGGFIMEHLEDVREHERIFENASRTSEVIKSVGGTHLVVIDDMYTDLESGEQTRNRELGDKDWAYLVVAAEQIGRIALDYGVRPVFHPHADTHVESVDHVNALMEQIESKYLGLCLDTGHLEYRGADPTEVFQRWADRTDYVHLKSVSREAAQVVREKKLSFAKAVEHGVFTEPGADVAKTATFLDALVAHAFQGVIVIEQDVFPAAPGSARTIAERSRRLVAELLGERVLLADSAT